jgi:hypothetical protein
VVGIPARAVHLSLLQSVQTDCGAKLFSCSVGTGKFYPGGKTTGLENDY